MKTLIVSFPSEIPSEILQYLEDHGYLDMVALGSITAAINGDQSILVDIMDNHQECMSDAGMSEKHQDKEFDHMYQTLQRTIDYLTDHYRLMTSQLKTLYHETGVLPHDAQVHVDRELVVLLMEDA